MKTITTVLLSLAIVWNIYSQNVGVNEPNPSQPLEVGGIIFSNEGGVMFPDSTVQMSAAASHDPVGATLPNHSIGIMSIPGVNGPHDEQGFSNTFRVFDIDFSTDVVVNAGPTFGGATLAKVELITDAGEGLPTLFDNLVDHTIIPVVHIDFRRLMTGGGGGTTSETYLLAGLGQAVIIGIDLQLKYKGSGAYGHFYKLTLFAEQLSIKSLDGSDCHCHDFRYNIDCACID